MYDYPIDRTGPYRSRRGIIFGVCRGLAEYFNVSVFWTRVLVLIAFVFTGFWPLGVVYLVAALLMKKAPRYACSVPPRRPPRHTGEDLDERLHNLRTGMDARERDWDARLNQG